MTIRNGREMPLKNSKLFSTQSNNSSQTKTVSSPASQLANYILWQCRPLERCQSRGNLGPMIITARLSREFWDYVSTSVARGARNFPDGCWKGICSPKPKISPKIDEIQFILRRTILISLICSLELISLKLSCTHHINRLWLRRRF
jgi:hypothetical protein